MQAAQYYTVPTPTQQTRHNTHMIAPPLPDQASNKREMDESRATSATGALFALEEDGDGDGDGAVGAKTISSLTCECRMN